AVRKAWLSAIGTPWLVVSGPSGGGARSVSRQPPCYPPSLTGPAPPVLALLFISLGVLAAARSLNCGDTDPAGGAPAGSYSLGLVSLYRMLPATSPTNFACFTAGLSALAGAEAGPPSVPR